MSYFDKIAEKVDAVETNAFDELMEDAHVKIAMIDEAANVIAAAAEIYQSEDLQKTAEVLSAIVETEAVDVDDTLMKMAEMNAAGPFQASVLEKHASDTFGEDFMGELERLDILSDVSDFVKTAAEEAQDEVLYEAGEAIDAVMEADLEGLDEIAKEAGFKDLLTAAKELSVSGGRGAWKGIKGGASGVWKGTKATGRAFKTSGKATGGYLWSGAKLEGLRGGAKALKGAEGSEAKVEAYKNILKGIGRGGLVYGVPLGAAGAVYSKYKS